MKDEFKDCNVYTKKDCRECFARFYCSGGCAANAWHFQNDIKGSYEIGCELQRKRVECADHDKKPLWLNNESKKG